MFVRVLIHLVSEPSLRKSELSREEPAASESLTLLMLEPLLAALRRFTGLLLMRRAPGLDAFSTPPLRAKLSILLLAEMTDRRLSWLKVLRTG